jgi:ATP-binding cassette subfamily B multidrug efflux pump
MFRVFEKLVSPYPNGTTPDLPHGFFAFLWACARGARRYIAADTSLLHRSVRENILYGRPDASDAEMIVAAKRAEAHDFIVTLSDPKSGTGYSAHVGERGVKLRGGLRQRIAIAHRLSTIAAMDRLNVLDRGIIVEECNHYSLLAQMGLYARLWAHQSGGFLGETEDPEAQNGGDLVRLATEVVGE